MIRPGTVWVWEEGESAYWTWLTVRGNQHEAMDRWTTMGRVASGWRRVPRIHRVGLSSYPANPRTNENMSPPTSHDMYGDYRRSSREPLIKQTYSTTMTNPSNRKQKKFHVVAYSSKVSRGYLTRSRSQHNPQGDAHNPLPLPHQLPLLATLTITPGIWPEWEHRRDDSTPAATPRSRSYPQTPAAAQYNPRQSDRYHPYYDPRTSHSPYPGAPSASSSGDWQDRAGYPEYQRYDEYRHSHSPERPYHPREHLGPPDDAAAAAASRRSPKMSIGSSLLNSEVTLPPLRVAIESDGATPRTGEQVNSAASKDEQKGIS